MINMRVEDTHLWKDYHNGCEEEDWQDQDPFEMDKEKDIFDYHWEEDYSDYRSSIF